MLARRHFQILPIQGRTFRVPLSCLCRVRVRVQQSFELKKKKSHCVQRFVFAASAQVPQAPGGVRTAVPVADFLETPRLIGPQVLPQRLPPVPNSGRAAFVAVRAAGGAPADADADADTAPAVVSVCFSGALLPCAPLPERAAPFEVWCGLVPVAGSFPAQLKLVAQL